MPPLDMGEYRPTELNPLLYEFELSVGKCAIDIMESVRKSLGLSYGIRIKTKKGVDSPKAHYVTDAVKDDRRITSWLHDGGWETKYYDLWLQVEKQIGEEWKAAGDPVMFAEIDRTVGNVEFERWELRSLLPEEQKRLLSDYADTIDRIQQVTESSLAPLSHHI